MQGASTAGSRILKGVRDDHEFTADRPASWASGGARGIPTAALRGFGALLVEAFGISPGQRVLAVSAGNGDVAIRAVEKGADVVALELTPDRCGAGRREPDAGGGAIVGWLHAGAEALPFGDDEFDVVGSAFGGILAPRHRNLAAEFVRVCRPGGTVGLAVLRPSRAVCELFAILGRYAHVPLIGVEWPLHWGSAAHVRDVFGDAVESLSLERRSVAPSRLVDVEFLKAHHPALAALSQGLADRPDQAALDRALGELARRWPRDAQELVLIVARIRA